MSEFDDIDEGADETKGDAPADANEVTVTTAEADCLSCGNPIGGAFCTWCGQKNDDLRRSSFLLARDFMRDTLGFESRMWRTLGLMAIAPGLVPKNYAHGKRSRFTPPVRMFLVVSFLFFLTIAMTKTLFFAVEVRKASPVEQEVVAAINADANVELPSSGLDCGLSFGSRFFVKEKDLELNSDLWDACLKKVRDQGRAEIENPQTDQNGIELSGSNISDGQAIEIMERILTGADWLVADPNALNNSFNNWLPRILLAMTPILALVLTLFVRGRDALVFDHLVLSFYTHATAFAVIAVALVLAQLGVPHTGFGAFLGIGVYYLAALKRAYGRGWVKTIWTVLMSGLLYWVIMLSIVMAIVANIIWQASG
ncbi:MAG: DUF3667 domain-containing protein [Pseudomonadota bacterium]